MLIINHELVVSYRYKIFLEGQRFLVLIDRRDEWEENRSDLRNVWKISEFIMIKVCDSLFYRLFIVME